MRCQQYDTSINRVHITKSKQRKQGKRPKKRKAKRGRGAELVYLGHIIGSSGVKIDPEKTKSVREWPTPKSLTEVRSFLGMTLRTKD